MAHIVTLLDTAGRPRVFINADQVTEVLPATEPTEGIIVSWHGGMKRVGNDMLDVIQIINSGVTPEYELDEEGVSVYWVDPRKPVPTPAEQKTIAQSEEESLQKAGFGAKVEDADQQADPDEDDTKKYADPLEKDTSASSLRSVATGKTAFGKTAKK